MDYRQLGRWGPKLPALSSGTGTFGAFHLDRPTRGIADAVADAGVPATIDVLPSRTHNDHYGLRNGGGTAMRRLRIR